MAIRISELLEKDWNVSLINEKEFDCFARATTKIDGRKCIFLSDKKYIKSIDSAVAMVITTEMIASELLDTDCGICISDEPRGLFFELMTKYESGEGFKKYKTSIGENCQISKTAIISDHNVSIGNNVKIGDYVVIHPNVEIGDNVTIQTGARIAEQDFNVYKFRGKLKQLYHSGKVVIGDNVIISPNVLIGQALYKYGSTVIGESCCIGGLTGIGHNSVIEDNCEICGGISMGGYCHIGKNSIVYMNSTIANGISIGENVIVNMGSVVVRSVPDNVKVFGNPAREVHEPKISN